MLLGLGFCQGDETISAYSPEGVTWNLASIDGVAFDSNATITFPKEGEIAGKAPCNSYFGKQSAPYPWFGLKDIGATRMACPDLEQENLFFAALNEMTISEVVGTTMILTNETGGEMVFEAN